MKRVIIMIFIGILLIICLSACDNSNNTQNDENNNIEMLRIEVETDSGEKYTERRIASVPSIEGMKINKIGDNFFIEATNDVYYNLQEYIGKGISLQGFVRKYEADNGDICYAVIRNTPRLLWR